MFITVVLFIMLLGEKMVWPSLESWIPVIASILSFILGGIFTFLIQFYTKRHEREMIIRKKFFEERYSLGRDLYTKMGGIYYQLRQHSYDLTQLNKYNKIEKREGGYRKADIIAIKNFYLSSINPNEDKNEIQTFADKDPSGVIQLIKLNLTEKYKEIIITFDDIFNEYNPIKLEFYYNNPELQQIFIDVHSNLRNIYRLHTNIVYEQGSIDESITEINQLTKDIKRIVSQLKSILQDEIQ